MLRLNSDGIIDFYGDTFPPRRVRQAQDGCPRSGTGMSAETRKYPLPPRLRNTGDFRRVRRYGKRRRLEFLVLYVNRLPLRHEPGRDPVMQQGRVGFTVPEKVSKKAVKRNRIRRMMKEAVRHWWPYILKGHDLVLIVGGVPKIDRADYIEAVFLRQLLHFQLLDPEGRELAEKKLANFPGEYHEKSGRSSSS